MSLSLHKSDGAHGILPCPSSHYACSAFSIHLGGHYDSRTDQLTKVIPLSCPVLRDAVEFGADPSSLNCVSLFTTHSPHTLWPWMPRSMGGELCVDTTWPVAFGCRNNWFSISIYLEMMTVFLASIPECTVWPACSYSDRQHDGDVLSEQSRGVGIRRILRTMQLISPIRALCTCIYLQGTQHLSMLSG